MSKILNLKKIVQIFTANFPTEEKLAMRLLSEEMKETVEEIKASHTANAPTLAGRKYKPIF